MKSDLRSGGSENPFLWARGIAARETLRYLDRNRITAEPLLAKAELSRDQLSQESVGVSVASQYRCLELTAIETNDQRSARSWQGGVALGGSGGGNRDRPVASPLNRTLFNEPASVTDSNLDAFRSVDAKSCSTPRPRGQAAPSISHFSRSFKLAVGVGPQRHVTQRRIERAKTLMRRTNQPLGWDAQEVGCIDQSH